MKEVPGGRPGLPVIVLMVSVDVKQHSTNMPRVRAQELCERKAGWPSWAPRHNPYGLCGREAALNLLWLVEGATPGSEG